MKCGWRAYTVVHPQEFVRALCVYTYTVYIIYAYLILRIHRYLAGPVP
jgi:hypothetical protein